MTLGVGAAAYFSYEIGRQGKTFSNAILGAYSILGDSSYSVRETLRWSLYHLGELDLAVGILPFAAFVVLLAVGLRRHPPSRQTRVFAVVALSATVWLTLEVGAFASTAFGRQIQERNLFYLEPLFLIALVVWAGKRLPRSPVANGAGAVTAAALVALVPYPTFLTPNAVGNAFGLLPLFRLEQHGWVAPAHLTEATTLFALAAGLVFVLLPYRLALVAPALVLVYLAAMNSPIEGLTSQASRDSRRGGVQNARDWIDRKVGTAPRVAAIWSNTDGQNFVTLWDNEFFNRSVGPVYNLKGSPDGLPQQTVSIDATSGVLHDSAGAVLRKPYVLTDRTLGIAGGAVARDNGTGMVLYRVGGPIRLASQSEGIYTDSWSGPVANYTIYDCRGGTLSFALLGDRAINRHRQTIVARDRDTGALLARTTARPGRVARFVVPLPAGPGGVPHFILSHSDGDPGGDDGIRRYAGPRDSLSPSALPAWLDPGDERVLGLADPVGLGVSAAARIDDLRFGEPVDQRQRAGHLREDRRAVGRIDPERLEGLHGVGVHGLGDEQPAWPQGSPGERQQALELVVGQMLDHVDRGDRAEASFRLGFEVGDGVCLLDREAFRPRALDHSLVDVHAAGLDARLREQLEQLASAAAEVDDRLMAAQHLYVRLEQLAHPLLGPAEHVLERCVGAPADGDFVRGVRLGVKLLGEDLQLLNRVDEPVSRALELVDPGDQQRLELALPHQVGTEQAEEDASPDSACDTRP